MNTLRELPTDFTSQRDDLHRLAYSVVAEARRRATGRFGLRATPGGFGTPEFEDGRRVRVEGHDLVLEHGSEVERFRITSLAGTAGFVGVEPSTEAAEHDSPPLGDIHAELHFDDATVRLLGDWYELATSVLTELGEEPGAVDVGIVQLWPGHFDAAIEIGDGDAGKRATYGASPGDDNHAEPYLYVGAWSEVDRSDDYWNDTNFSGASLSYSDLRSAGDARAVALAFFRAGYNRLTS